MWYLRSRGPTVGPTLRFGEFKSHSHLSSAPWNFPPHTPREPPPAEDEDELAQSIKSLLQEAGSHSIKALLSNHPRDHLFVPPLLWDHRQPALLQCRFLPPEPAPRLSADQEIPMSTPSLYGPIDTTDIEVYKDPLWKSLRLHDLLTARHPNATFFDRYFPVLFSNCEPRY
jgi:hypothetical protein